jgi:4-hydroxy-4-methyl-2-oxoglutarate aldolase
MANANPLIITLDMMRESLYAAVICDVLDAAGYPNQSPRVPFGVMTVRQTLVGRCKTTLWSDMAHADPKPYELELAAVDSCRADDVLIAAAGGSARSGIWGELLTTAARNQGCVGAIVDGMVRDVAKMRALQFPVFARGTCIYDSKDRQRVIDLDVPVEIDGVRFSPGDLVVADEDGIVVVPRTIEEQIVRSAWEKVHAENEVRDAIKAGMKATAAFRKFGVL